LGNPESTRGVSWGERDHTAQDGGGTSGGVPALTFSTTNASGEAETGVLTDATIALFDNTAPAALESVAASGDAGVAADRAHVHEFPESLQSDSSSSTLTLTDVGGRQTLKGDLGDITIDPADSGSMRLLSTTDFSQKVGIGTLPAGNTMFEVLGVAGAFASQALSFSIQSAYNSATQPTRGVLGSVGTTLPDAEGQSNLKSFDGLIKILGVNKTVPTSTGTESRHDFVLADGTTVLTDQRHFWGKEFTETAPVADPVVTNAYGVDIEVYPSWVVNSWGIRTKNRAEFSNPSGRDDTVLELRQGNTGAAEGAHINLDDKAGDVVTPTAGDLWRNANALKYMAAIVEDLVPSRARLFCHMGA